jgi:voltage-gated potassium channel
MPRCRSCRSLRPQNRLNLPMSNWLARLRVWPPTLPGHRLTGRGAVRAIASFTFLVTLIAGLLIHIVDHREYPTLGRGLWWAVQTVTTVGYGDAVPGATGGRIVAVFVMLSGIAGVAVATAAISAALIEQARHRRTSPHEDQLAARLDALELQLSRIEDKLSRRSAA